MDVRIKSGAFLVSLLLLGACTENRRRDNFAWSELTNFYNQHKADRDADPVQINPSQTAPIDPRDIHFETIPKDWREHPIAGNIIGIRLVWETDGDGILKVIWYVGGANGRVYVCQGEGRQLFSKGERVLLSRRSEEAEMKSEQHDQIKMSVQVEEIIP